MCVRRPDWDPLQRQKPRRGDVMMRAGDVRQELGIEARLFLVYIESLTENPMRYSSQVKPISYLKAHAAEVLNTLNEQREPLVITQNGEARAVLQDVASYEATQETLALLKLLALGNQEIAAGKVKPVAEVVARLKAGKTQR